uniref:LEAF RUST 10 DISEASE-RESISTANCE LOCUS RECEPTOR-LIKE PROTEIN KINASE-like 1.4 isoform X2 n=1 Tax=Erigeron canadensis TaxID=72917 RepID=UPI001CB9B554|nr:LEAF RUST 10 DISEASE-RESISTANCE LOCUS RECEPTOR-LIKE PROTEIN KINASE-like 1.4 isoform X2 [Erigeron canadensis]
MNSKCLLLNLLILILIQAHLSYSDGLYNTCNGSFSCGTISGFEYPFRRNQDPPHCGYPGFEINCDERNPPTIDIMNITYQILSIDPASQVLRVIREDMVGSICPQNLVNTTIDPNLFNYTSSYMENSFLFGCPVSFDIFGIIGQIPCGTNGISPVFLVPGVQGPGFCQTSVVIPFPVVFNTTALVQLLREGFELMWKLAPRPCIDCTQSGGQCVYDMNILGTTCACPEPPLLANSCLSGATKVPPPSSGSSKNNSLTIVLPIVGVVIACIVLGCGILVCRRRRKRREMKEASPSAQNETKAILTKVSSSKFDSSIPSYPTSKTLKISTEYTKSSYFGAQVFSYEELEVATDNFNDSRELGDGGFGTVYYGKLLDGREVAVKRLYENNFKRVEQFMNEVQILSKLEHENLVKLYGCTSKRSKELVLVYEYIPNGTVADHLHGKLANSGSDLFSWSVRLNIAIETAEALAYLHKSDIIHRDVKTNNILLDKSFKVKVADFGLSRLFPDNATHVSTAPQGTPGYVDPEYYQCYHLTDKSDVYSFGVVLIELISSLQAVDTNRHRHDINLANMAVTKIQNHSLDELVDKSIGFETNGLVRRMTTLVAELAFRCLQQEKDMRPTMKEVVEILRGIQDDQLNAQKPEVLDIVVDDGGLSNDHSTQPSSSDSGVTNKQVGSSAPNSSDG